MSGHSAPRGEVQYRALPRALLPGIIRNAHRPARTARRLHM